MRPALNFNIVQRRRRYGEFHSFDPLRLGNTASVTSGQMQCCFAQAALEESTESSFWIPVAGILRLPPISTD